MCSWWWMRTARMGVFSSDGVIPTSLTPETSSPIRAESVFSLLQSRAGGICSSQQLLSLSLSLSHRGWQTELQPKLMLLHHLQAPSHRQAVHVTQWVWAQPQLHTGNFQRLINYSRGERKRHDWWLMFLFPVKPRVWIKNIRWRFLLRRQQLQLLLPIDFSTDTPCRVQGFSDESASAEDAALQQICISH